MYNQSGDIISIAHEFGNKIEHIPADTYTVEQNPQTGEFYLMRSVPFTRPAKVYGEMVSRNKKVINTFLNREGKNTGVLLSGTKGAGKTQLAKDVSIELLKHGIPTIIIQNCYTSGGFINFIKSIGDRALVLFDEFEKVYNEREDQEAILTLLDGTGSYNKLYILTSNNRNVSEFLRNRPSRIFYHFEYKKMAKQVMIDLLNDKLVNKAFIPHFETLWDVAETVSFDMIQCLVEELNRYPDQTFVETFREVNVEVETREGNAFVLSEFTIDGKEVKFDDKFTNTIRGYSFVAKYDILRFYFFVEEGTLQDEIRAIGALPYNDYDDEKEEESDGIKELQYFMSLEYNKEDTVVNSSGITINRTLNGHTIHVKFVKTEEPDVIETIFGDTK